MDLDRPTGKDRLLIESEMSTLRQTITNLENDIHNLNSEISIIRERLNEEISEKRDIIDVSQYLSYRSDSTNTTESESSPEEMVEIITY